MATMDIEHLRTSISGRVFCRNDLGYDDARKAWNENINQHPAVIVQPIDAADIKNAVRYAALGSTGIAVQGTGHGAVLPCDGGMLIDTSALTGVSINPTTRIAIVEPGAIWGPTMKAAQKHGLAGRAGFSAEVGVLGYSLGGGYGWLSRQHGLACDHIVAADVVLADGRLVRVNADEHADLLWALRGGAGTIGIVTSLEFGLVPLGTLYGGTLTFPLDRARQLFAIFASMTKDVDTRLTTSIQLSRKPSPGMIARMTADKPSVHVSFCFLGGEQEGERLVRGWLEAGPAHGSLGMVRPDELGTIEGPAPKGLKLVEANEQLVGLNGTTIETLVSCFEQGNAPIFKTEVRHVGGAISNNDVAAAFDRRDGEYLLHLQSHANGDGERDAARAWLDNTCRLLKPATTGAAALGFLGDGEHGMVAAKRAYSDDNRTRLANMKRRVDPDNLLRFNHNARLWTALAEPS